MSGKSEETELSYYLQHLDGFYRITNQKLKTMHYDGGYTHHDIAEKFGVSVEEFSTRLAKAGIDRLCDTCREKMTGLGPSPEYCSVVCETLANGESVVCSDCGEEIGTIGRWRAHNNHAGSQGHYQRLAESIDGHIEAEWKPQREAALHRADGRCEACDSTTDLEVHHIIKRRVFDDEKTAHALENLCVLCRSCHGRLENKTMRELVKEVVGE